MSEKSAIEWTDATWNPTTGCTKVSPACANCYIERTIPFRVRGRKFVNGHIPLELHPNRLDQPKHWRESKHVFVNSLSDLFHDDVPLTFILAVYRTMAQTPQHVYQVLTKRPKRMAEVVNDMQRSYAGRLDHVWHGVSTENQRMLVERVPWLLRTNSLVRFISAEPLLGPINIEAYLQYPPMHEHHKMTFNASEWRGLDWVIVGAESGPRVRPTNPEWVRSLRDQCLESDAAFFFKQWGGKTAKSGGRILDGRTWDELPMIGADEAGK